LICFSLSCPAKPFSPFCSLKVVPVAAYQDIRRLPAVRVVAAVSFPLVFTQNRRPCSHFVIQRKRRSCDDFRKNPRIFVPSPCDLALQLIMIFIAPPLNFSVDSCLSFVWLVPDRRDLPAQSFAFLVRDFASSFYRSPLCHLT